jgi:hypothetical protein
MNPEEAVKAAQDLGAKRLLPGHVGRFALARHAWDEPFERIQELSDNASYSLVIPMIGEALCLDGDATQHAHGWWREADSAASTILAFVSRTISPTRPCQPSQAMLTR